MRSRVSIVTVALALMLPVGAAFARPIDEPRSFVSGAPASDPVPGPARSGDSDAEPVGYIVVGLSGFALGVAGFAGACSVRRSRRAVEV